MAIFPAIDPSAFAGGVDEYFEREEAKVAELTPGTEKRVIWAGDVGAKTALSVVYLHGFSATSEEIRPVPDRVAKALGANLVFNRLTGHGLPGEEMAKARTRDWLRDTAEALAAARAVADEVIVIGTSTGATLGALAMLDPVAAERVKGITLVAPIIEFYHRAVRLLYWPGVRWWGPLIAGRDRQFEVRNPAHGTYWTTAYPMISVLPLAKLLKIAKRQDFGAATVPALFLYSQKDQVVLPAATEDVIATWGGPVTDAPQVIPPGNDPNEHVIAGDIMSPGMTDSAAQQIIDWAKAL